LLGHRSCESVESVLERLSSLLVGLLLRERLKKALAFARIAIV
jgi:hypothetical protein